MKMTPCNSGVKEYHNIMSFSAMAQSREQQRHERKSEAETREKRKQEELTPLHTQHRKLQH